MTNPVTDDAKKNDQGNDEHEGEEKDDKEEYDIGNDKDEIADKTTSTMVDIYDEIIEPTLLWLSLDADDIKAMEPYKKEEVFQEKNDSVHNCAALGHKIMKIDPGLIAEPELWFRLFNESFDTKGVYYKTKKAKTMRAFAIRLAQANPIQLFDKGFWDNGKLRLANVTNPWQAAYATMGATWTKEKTFNDFFDNYEDDSNDNSVYLHLPKETPEKQSVSFNDWNRKYVTFLKFRTPQFAEDDRKAREKEFVAFMIEMLETVWEMDPDTQLIPWDAESKAKAIKKSTKKFPNTPDGWRIYTDRVFIRKDSRCWPRVRFAHNMERSSFRDKNLAEAFRNNDSSLTIEPIQVYEASKLGWFLGSHTTCFNTETMKMALMKRPELRGIDIALRIEFIKVAVKQQGEVKAVHIYSDYNKAFEARQALIKIYGKGDSDTYPLGKNLRFIPDNLDTRFITTERSLKKIIKCVTKQEVFLSTSTVSRNFSIAGLDYYSRRLKMTLRQAVMGIRSVKDPKRNLFLNVDKQVTKSAVMFAYHNDLASEASAIVTALPVLLETTFDHNIWTWFTDDAKATAEGFQWDDKEGIIEKVERVNWDWKQPGYESDGSSVSEVKVSVSKKIIVDLENRGKSELNDDGSTVKSFKSMLRKRKHLDDNSMSVDSTISTLSETERFDQLMRSDPNFRAHVIKEYSKSLGNPPVEDGNNQAATDASGKEGN